jgi:hypothetical protein
MLGNILLLAVIATVIGGALAKLIIDKRKGIKCSGCPYSRIGANDCSCSGQQTGE